MWGGRCGCPRHRRTARTPTASISRAPGAQASAYVDGSNRVGASSEQALYQGPHPAAPIMHASIARVTFYSAR